MSVVAEPACARAATLYPAIDLRGGSVVRLAQGDYARETGYPLDPVELAQRYADAGARWLHLVDLDGAKGDRSVNGPIVAAIAAIPGLSIQAGGGVRGEDDVRRLLDAGVSRVVVGSLGVRSPGLVQAWLTRFGRDRLCVALDARQGDDGVFRLPVHGWTEATGATLDGVLSSYARHGGLKHVLCTDIARDGMLGGPNLALYRELSNRYPSIAVQASGGVRDLADVEAAFHAGAAGVVVGKALLEGRVPLEGLRRC